MDFSATIDLIIKDLDEAGKIIDDLKRYPGVPALQIELAKSKCKSAGEIIALLKDLKFNDSTAIETTHFAESTKTTAEEETGEIPFILEEEPSAEEETETISTAEVNKQIVSPEATVENEHPGREPESSIIADRFSHMSARLNEQMGNTGDDDISAKTISKHVTSLTEAIGVNDRFLFIREIFNGDSETYTKIITRLEKVESISDARAIIMSYTGQNNENEATRQLIELVKRKLPLHE
jgi:DNA-binding transcriptional ArsR family regulator